MTNLIITIIQTHLHWENPIKNIAHFDSKINAITESTDIIVLPEMFTTGFTMNPKLHAEEHGGNGLQWMTQKAKEKKCVIVGSISIKENNTFYNRLYWAKPDGTYEFYDKRHLFKMGNEHQHYSAGNKKLIVEYKGWKICPLICYDLRFPVWSRNKKDTTYDVLIYVANWPEVRAYPWKQLLIARAIENQTYVIGVNRIGLDGNNIDHSGDSVIINPKGEFINTLQAHQDKTESLSLSYTYLQDFRKAFPVLSDADEFEVL
jgi:predicted amidohydrolase